LKCDTCDTVISEQEKEQILGTSRYKILCEKFGKQSFQNIDRGDKLNCDKCLRGKTDAFYLNCDHIICKDCFILMAKQNISIMNCHICNSFIPESEKKNVLGEEEYNKHLDKFIQLDNIVECPNCKEKFEFIKGKIDFNLRDSKNEKLTEKYCVDYAENRFRCRKCDKESCYKCKYAPYHIGKTCDENKLYLNSKKCRYCNCNISAEKEVCHKEECIELFKTSCLKVLHCGHRCFGHLNETKCPPCLEKKCPGYINLFDQSSNDFCPICWSEKLEDSPLVLLKCGHYSHHKCLENIMKSWRGPKIKFNHIKCTACKNFLVSTNNPDLQEKINTEMEVYKLISSMSMERLKSDKLDKDKRLTDPNSDWFGKELEFALTKINYYNCYLCKKPYFAGLKECGGNPNDDNDPDKQFDPSSLICGNHNILENSILGQTECKTHGKDYIDYKCKFCCKIANWFCWGSTHFCEDCHSRQCKGDYVSKYTKEQLPKCGGASSCPLKINHPSNGEEFALGCSICRSGK
jgi:E3 ubiquitin-protein ligase MYCBP2